MEIDRYGDVEIDVELDMKIDRYTKVLEVNLVAFAYRLFHRDFSPLDRKREISMKQSVGKYKQINF